MDKIAPYLSDPDWFQKQSEAIASGKIPMAILRNVKAPIYPKSAAVRAAVASYGSDIKLGPTLPKINTAIDNTEDVNPESIATPIKDSEMTDFFITSPLEPVLSFKEILINLLNNNFFVFIIFLFLILIFWIIYVLYINKNYILSLFTYIYNFFLYPIKSGSGHKYISAFWNWIKIIKNKF